MVVGFLGSFFGNWIKASVSRQREFLADASAVQFTRNPAGIAGALKRIGGFTKGSQIDSPNAPEASHMFFGQALEPIHLRHASAPAGSHPAPGPFVCRGLDCRYRSGFRIRVIATAPASALSERLALSPQAVAAQVGRPTPAHIQYAHALLEDLPGDLRAAAHEPYGARALVYALVISREEPARSSQLEQTSRARGFRRGTADAETPASSAGSRCSGPAPPRRHGIARAPGTLPCAVRGLPRQSRGPGSCR